MTLIKQDNGLVLADYTERIDEMTRAIIQGITRKTGRDEQKSIGPSEIGNPCDYCVGRALCRRYPQYWPDDTAHDDHFSLKAWMGTAVHEKLERDVELEGALKESTVNICELDGYGPISGHVDLIWNGIITDYKTIDRSRLDLLRLHGAPVSYVRQINLYAYGASRNHGMDASVVCLLFIPRDSNKIGDAMRIASRADAAVAEDALARLEGLWDRVRRGEGPMFSSSEECYRCTVRQWG